MGGRERRVVCVNDIVLGILAVLIGGLFCARGFVAMRIAIPMWGAFIGFLVGAGLLSAWTDDGVLGTALGWFVGFGVALLFGAIAYLYYEFAVMLALGSIGFTLGASAVTAIGVTWSWVVVLAGLLLGIALAVFALVVDLPTILLVTLTALGGAGGIVFGLLLLTGSLDSDELSTTKTTDVIDLDWWWFAIYAALVISGVIAQARTAARLDETWRESWQRGLSTPDS